MSNHPRVQWIASAEDPLRAPAQRICADHAARLPDLTHVIILLPDLTAAPRLRRELLHAARAHGHHALLGPHVHTLRTFAAHDGHVPHHVINGYARELMLAEALESHRHLYGQSNPWTLAGSLLELFDELTLHSCALPPHLAAFQEKLARAYGVREVAPQALSREAALVHTLWRAWHRQLQDLGAVDQHAAYLLQLSGSVAAIAATRHVYGAGFHALYPAEIEWLRAVAARVPCEITLQAALVPDDDAVAPLPRLATAFDTPLPAPTPADPRGELIAAAFDSSATPIAQRARAFAARFPHSPLTGQVAMFAAASAEEEAVAVDVQVRRWLLNGAASVGIVTEDRRLARRVRALLERAGITLDDRGGWALSTTSAATVLERWLQCVEEDFAYEPLLDVLKSPFVFADVERDEHLRRVYRLEEDVIRNENVARGLQRYRMRLQRRRERLPPELAAAYPAVETLLEQLQFAAAPLTALCDGRPHAPATLLGAVRESAQRLGLEQRWQTDAAGARVLHELDLLQHAAQSSGLRLRWDEFRAWLGRAFENSHFVPPHSAGAVQLLNLTQSATARFDAIVIAGCDYEHLPGAAPASPFFNDAVRRELGLPPAAHRHALLRQFFLGALERTPRVLLTRVSARDDEEVVASPWWDTLEAFHRLAWGTLPRDTTLEAYVAAPQARVKNGDEVPDPAPATLPRVSIASALLPGVISADSYQRLLDCPYQFYAAHCLKLKPPEHVREALRKDDFGARVHACLEAFFHPVAGLPPPFSGRVTHANREAAIAHLETIARAVFARDLEDNFQHRGWLRRWLAVVPEFIDWQIERAAEWTPSAVELRRERHAAGLALTLKGRLDRVDAGGAGLGIIDYKTGYVPSADDVAQGEAVQLPFYALLMKDAGQAVTRAEHVEIGTDKVTSKTPLEHATLGALADATEARLAEVIAQLRDGRAAPAWGDTKTCERCPMEGLCRKALWNRNGEEAEALGRGQ